MLSPETIAFLKDLAANNDREWFKANEARYKEHYKFAGEEFAAALAEELGEALGTKLDFRIFRIHRDVRFSKDKTPYNTHLRVVFGPPGCDADHPRWMAGLEEDQLVTGVGLFGFSKPGLVRYRERVDGPDGDRLASIIAELTGQGARLSEPDLKRVPPPYDKDHRHADLLRHKGLAIWHDHKSAKPALGNKGPSNVAGSLLQMRPFHDWLAEQAG